MTQFDSLGGMNVVFSADIAAAMKAIDAFGATLTKVTDGVAAKLKVFDAGFEEMNKAVASSAKATTASFDAFDARLKQLAQDAPSHTDKVKHSLESLGSGGAQKAEAGIRSFGTTVREVSESAAASLKKLGGSFEVLETLIAGAIAEKGFDKFKELDRSLAELQGALEQTSSQFATVRSEVIAFASSINAPVQALADSVRRFVQVQFTVPEALKLSQVALMGGRAAMVDAKTATDALVTTLRSFHIPAEDAARTMGQLVTAGEQSAGGFAEFAQALTQIGPLANQFNFKLADTLGILRLLTNQSGSVSEATVKFRAILQELATIDPYGKQGEKLREVLGTTIELALASEGPVEVFKKLIVAANGSSAAIHELVGSGRAAAAFIRIAGEGIDKLEASVEKFREVGVNTLTEAYARQKETVFGLLTTSQKLVSNTIQLAFERNAEAIKSSLKALNDFLIRNKETVSQVVQAAFYFSAAVVALNAFRGAVILTAKALEVLSVGIVAVQSGIKLLAGLVTGNLITGFATAVPKITALAVAIKELALTNIGIDAFRASAGLKSLSDGGLVLTQTFKGFADENSGVSQSFIGVGETAHTAEQRVAGVTAAIGRLVAQVTAFALVGTAFYLVGRQIGDALVGAGEAGNRAYESVQDYNASLQATVSRTQAATDASVRLKASGEEEQAILRELIALQRELNNERDPAKQKIIRKDIDEKTGRLGELKSTQEDDRAELQARISALRQIVGSGQREIETSITNTLNRAVTVADFASEAAAAKFAGRFGPAIEKFFKLRDSGAIKTTEEFKAAIENLAASEAAAVPPIEKVTAALIASGKSKKEAAAEAATLVKELTTLNTTAANFDANKAAAAGAAALAESQDRIAIAAEKAKNATTVAEKSIEKLGESFDAAGGHDALDRRLASLSDEADKGVRAIHQLNDAIAFLETQMELVSDAGEKSSLQKKVDDLNEIKDKLARGLQDIDEAQRRAIEDDRARRQREVDEQIKQLDTIRDETLRNLGLEVEAEKAAAKAKLNERLRAAEELRKSPNADAAGLADKQIEAARRAYDAELGRIERNQAEKEKGYATARAAAQRADDDAKRLALLAEAEELKARAAEARKRGDLRTETALREQVAKLIQESGDRTAELLNKEKDVLKSVRERFDLAKQEVETRVRLGEGGAGIVAGVRSGLSAIAGASDAPTFRAGVRDRFGLAQTESGAKELFGTVKQLLEAEFAGLQQQEREARKSRNSDDVLKAQQGQKDVAEKYRILNEELGRTVKEIKAQPGGKPGEAFRPDTLVNGRDVRPDEKAPPGVRIVGPATKDAGVVDAEARFKRGEIKIDNSAPITVTVAPSTKPIRIDDSKPLDVHVTNPAPGSKTEATKNASAPVSGPAALGAPGPGVDVGGGGIFKAVSDMLALAALGSSGFGSLPGVSGRGSNLPPGPDVGPPGFLAGDFVGPVRLGAIPKELPKDQLERQAAFKDRQAAVVTKGKTDKEARAREDAARQIESIRRTSSPKDAQRRIDQINKRLADQFGSGDAGTGTGAATPAPDGFVGPPAPTAPTDAPKVPGAPAGPTAAPGSAASDTVQKTFDAVTNATSGVAALGDKLLSAVTASGDAMLSAMTTFSGKLSETVDQINSVTKKVQAIEDSAQLLRIEGRA